MLLSLGVPNAGIVKKREEIVRQFVSTPPKTGRILRSPRTVTVVPSIILAPAVVEESEEADHRYIRTCPRREQKPVPLHPPPVVRPVNGMTLHMHLAGHNLPKTIKINIHRNEALPLHHLPRGPKRIPTSRLPALSPTCSSDAASPHPSEGIGEQMLSAIRWIIPMVLT